MTQLLRNIIKNIPDSIFNNDVNNLDTITNDPITDNITTSEELESKINDEISNNSELNNLLNIPKQKNLRSPDNKHYDEIKNNERNLLNKKTDLYIKKFTDCLDILKEDNARLIDELALNEFLNILSLKLIEKTYDFDSLFNEINNLNTNFELFSKYRVSMHHHMDIKYILPFMYYQNFIDYINFIKTDPRGIINRYRNDNSVKNYKKVIKKASKCLNKNNKYYNTNTNHIINYYDYLYSNNRYILIEPIEIYRMLSKILHSDEFFKQIFTQDKTFITNNETLIKLYDKIDNIYDSSQFKTNKYDFNNIKYNMDYNFISNAYDRFHNSDIYVDNKKKKTKQGQFFTPANISDILVYLVKPSFMNVNGNLQIESFYDPAFGSARIIQSIIEHYIKESKRFKLFIKETVFYDKNNNIIYKPEPINIPEQLQRITNIDDINNKNNIIMELNEEELIIYNEYLAELEKYNEQLVNFNQLYSNDGYSNTKIDLQQLNKLFNDNIYGSEIETDTFKKGLLSILTNTGIFLNYVRQSDSITNLLIKSTNAPNESEEGYIDKKKYYFNISENQKITDMSTYTKYDTAKNKLLQDRLDSVNNESVIKNKQLKQFDIICLNPPFNININILSPDKTDEDLSDICLNYNNTMFPFKFGTKKSELLFLEYVINRLKIDGRGAIILPENQILKTTSKNIMKFRQFIFYACKIKKIIKCPPRTFGYTDIPTIIVYFEKKRDWQDILQIEYKKIKNIILTKDISNIEININNNELCTTQLKFYNIKDIEYEMNLYNECKYKLYGRTSKDYKQIYKNFKNYKTKPILIVNTDQIKEQKYSLSFESYYNNKINIIELNNGSDIEYKKISEICKFIPRHKNNINIGSEIGKYNFYCNNTKILRTDQIDYHDEYIIILNTGCANVNIDSNFGCAEYNFVLSVDNSIDNNSWLNKFIYYYLLFNLNALNMLFVGLSFRRLSKQSISNFLIPKLRLDKQQEIITFLEYKIMNKYNITKLNKIFINKNIFNYLINYNFDIFTNIYEEENKIYNHYKLNDNNFYVNILMNNYDFTIFEKNTLGDILKFENVKYREIEDANKSLGKYNFYTSSSTKVLKIDHADYKEEYLIIGTGGKANIKIDSNFSCSNHNFIATSKNENILNKYIYYYLNFNIQKIEVLFSGACIKHLSINNLKNIEVEIPSIDIQRKIINELEYITKCNELKINMINTYIPKFIAKYKLK